MGPNFCSDSHKPVLMKGPFLASLMPMAEPLVDFSGSGLKP